MDHERLDADAGIALIAVALAAYPLERRLPGLAQHNVLVVTGPRLRNSGSPDARVSLARESTYGISPLRTNPTFLLMITVDPAPANAIGAVNNAEATHTSEMLLL